MSTKSNSVKDNAKDKVANIYGLPVLFALGIIPLIIHTYVYQTGLTDYEWFSANDAVYTDIFLTYKMRAIIGLAIVALLMLVYRKFSNLENLKWEKPFWCLAVYGVFVIISASGSEMPNLAFGGAFEMFESAWAVIGYLVIFYYSYSFIKSESNVRWIIISFSFLFAFMLLIGVLQGLKIDPLSFKFVRYIIAPADIRDSLSSARAPGTAYLTLYNENYMSMYFGILIPIAIAVVIAAEKVYAKVIGIVLIIASIFVLLHGQSASGWFGIIGSAIVVGIIYSTRDKKTLRIGGIAFVIVAIIGIIAAFKFPPVHDRLVGSFLAKDSDVDARIVELYTDDDEIVFIMDDGKELHTDFVLTQDGYLTPSFRDKDGNELTCTLVDDLLQLYKLDSEEYPETTVRSLTADAVTYFGTLYNIDGKDWMFENFQDGTYYYINPLGKYVKLQGRPKKSDFFPNGFFSNRGIIWDYCLPLLSEHILTGAGSNLFVLAYPQDDYIYKNYLYGRSNFNYDVKAHSFYFQQWMENGFIAFLCIMIVFIWYVIRGIRIYRRADFKDPFTIIGYGFYAGCIAYMAVVLANDSNVCTAPVFWATFGISIGINRLIAEKIELPEIKMPWKKV